MIRITKTKVAGALAAGVLTLGGAGAYAANNTITVGNPQPITIGSGSDQLKLISVDGKSLNLPSSFTNHGDCVSFFATNRDFALAPASSGTASGGSVKISKNFHGKLVSAAAEWCRTSAAGVTKSSADADSEAASSEAAEASETGDHSSQKAGKSGGTEQHGRGPRH